jgi:hypothetical protein
MVTGYKLRNIDNLVGVTVEKDCGCDAPDFPEIADASWRIGGGVRRLHKGSVLTE